MIEKPGPGSWIEVCVCADEETAESAAGLLGVLTGAGVWVRGRGEAVEAVTYLPADADLEARKAELVQALGGFRVWFTAVPDRDWAEEFKASCPALAVGERFWIAPTWSEQAAPEGRIELRIDPRMGFGSGRHETTRLMLEFLQERLRPGASVLDVGSGSGILVIGAHLLGAGALEAVELDPQAVQSARDNEAANRVPDSRIVIFNGSLFDYEPGFVPDLLLANLETDIFARCAGRLARWSGPGTVVVLGGIETGHRARARELLAPHFDLVEERVKGDWTAYRAVKRSG